MSLFKPASNNQAFLKMSLVGFGKTGKSFTAMLTAIALHRHIKSKKPIFWFDTETGSNYVADTFKACGIKLEVAKTRSFVDLLSATKEAEKASDIYIVDSVTHPYAELVNGYKTKLDRKKLRVWDWDPIKSEWSVFRDLFLNSSLHIIICGRAGWEYEDREDEEGVTQTQKTGIKMKAETDFGYEPGLAVEMERIKDESRIIGQAVTQRAWVVGDRFNAINGRHFDFPTEPNENIERAIDRVWNAFSPHILKLNIGADYTGVNTQSKSADLFDSPASRSNWIKRKEIALETLKIELDKRWSSRSDAGAKERVKWLEANVGTAAQTAISDMSPEDLEKAITKLKAMEAPNA